MFFCSFVKKSCTQTTQNFAPLREEFHTELKVAVRTCEGKAIHGIHRKVFTYLRKVSATKICPYVLLYNKFINS